MSNKKLMQKLAAPWKKGENPFEVVEWELYLRYDEVRKERALDGGTRVTYRWKNADVYHVELSRGEMVPLGSAEGALQMHVSTI